MSLNRINVKRYSLLLITLLFTAPNLFAQANLEKGLIAKYLFNGTAKDASTYGNHGKRVGGVTDAKDRFGNDCGAFAFNGLDGYVTVSHATSLSKPRDEITVAVWMKLIEGTPFSDLQWMTVVCKSENTKETINHPQYRLQSTKVTLSVNTEFTENTKHDLDYNTWFFYVMTYDGETVKAFKDGEILAEYRYMTEFQPNNSPLNIGRDLPGVLEFFAGIMDELRIYDRALSKAEIQQLYKDDSEKKSPKPCNGCTISSIEATPGNCYEAAGQSVHDVRLKIYYEGAPSRGTLQVEVPGAEGEIPFDDRDDYAEVVLEGVLANGKEVPVRTYFTNDKKCAYQSADSYTAPAPCKTQVAPCTIQNITAKAGRCYESKGFSVFDLNLEIEHENPSNYTELIVSVKGKKQKVAVSNTSMTSTRIIGLAANGRSLDIIAYFTKESSCKLIKKALLDAPKACPPSPNTSVSKDCVIKSLVANPGNCYEEGGESLYDLNLNIDYANAPSNKELQVYVDEESKRVTCNSKTSSEMIRVHGLKADGATKDVVIYFTEKSDCALINSAAFTAPSPCVKKNTKCQITDITATTTACKPSGQIAVYEAAIKVSYENPPNAGVLIVKVGKVEKKVNFDNNRKTVNVNFTQLPATGNPVLVTAHFEANSACIKIKPSLFRAPENCATTEDVEAGSIDYQQEVTVKNPNIKLLLYDHQKQDGDIVSVRWDGKWIVNKLKLKSKAQAESIEVELIKGQVYELVSKAWNLGTVPPNTLTVEILDVATGESQLIKLNSEIGQSGAMKIQFK